jgi:hypothetical protein
MVMQYPPRPNQPGKWFGAAEYLSGLKANCFQATERKSEFGSMSAGLFLGLPEIPDYECRNQAETGRYKQADKAIKIGE